MEKPKKYEDLLMDALAFDEDDVAANRTGHFSNGQHARLRSQWNTEVSLAVLFTLVPIVLLAALLLTTHLPAATVIPVIALFTPLVVLLFAAFMVKALRLRADLRDDQVLSAEGRISLQLEYFLNVGDKRFPLKERAFLAFKNGDPYRVYYSQRSKRLLSVEWLRENDDNLLETPPDSAIETRNARDDAEDDPAATVNLKLRR